MITSSSTKLSRGLRRSPEAVDIRTEDMNAQFAAQHGHSIILAINLSSEQPVADRIIKEALP